MPLPAKVCQAALMFVCRWQEAVQHAFWEAGLLEDMSVSCRDAEIPFDGFLSALGRWHSLDLFEGRNHNLNHLGRSSRDGIDTSGRDVTVRGAKMALSMLGEIKE